MSKATDRTVSRRGFLKAAGATAVAAAATGQTPVLRALTVDAHAAAPQKPYESKFSACAMCFNKCGLIARLENGVVKKLDPNPKFLKSRGMLCARGNAGVSHLYNPDRLKYPLLRQGERGEGKWKRISWEEALDLAAVKLAAIGKQYTRCGFWFAVGADDQSQFLRRLAEAYGSYNITSHESLCLLSNNRAFLDTFGEVPFPDVLHTKYVLMAGANRFEALVTPDSIDLMTAMKQGMKLVVLDPRYTKTAGLASEWHAIRPGTDMAFMLALMHVLIAENLYDASFVEARIYGLEQLAEHVRQYPPEWAEKECGVPADDIRRIAREMAAAAPRAMVYPGRRTSDYENSTQIRRSFAMLNALLGNWDQPGGLLGAREVGLKGLPLEAPWYDDNPEERADAGRAPLMFEEEGSFVLMREAVISGEPYPVKGLFTYHTNPMQTAPDRMRTMEMIKKLDFMISVDVAMSDTAWMADLVLPSQSYLERLDPASALQGSSACACVIARDPVVPPMFECWAMFDIAKNLAQRLDLGEHFDFDVASLRKVQLSGLPDAQKALTADGVYYNPSKVYGIYAGKPHKTQSAKIELYNQRYAEKGLDPMPVYTPPNAGEENALRMVIGRNALVTHSSTQNNPLLHEMQETNVLWIHPEPAKKLGVKDGRTVVVASKAGKGELTARVTGEIRPDTVYMLSGFGGLSKDQTLVFDNGASIAGIIESGYDALCGNAAMHETFVTVTPKGAAS